MFDFVEESVGREVDPGRFTDFKKKQVQESEEEKEEVMPDFTVQYADEFDAD